MNEWGDDDGSRWEDEIDFEKEKNIQLKELEWNADNEFEEKKRGPYKIGKTPKLTYYDKWSPSGSFTKSAIGTSKITSEQNESEEEDLYEMNKINTKIKDLKEELEGHHNKMKLLYNVLPVSFQEKHQKTIRLIDDEDVTEKYHIWIQDQHYKVTPIKFKEFIEQNLLIQLGINKKKTINISTAVCWLHILGALKKQFEDYYSQPNTLERRVKRLEKDVKSLKIELKDLDECMDKETVIDLI
ncbi:12061_t:CDS:2 [Funneliformis geosporum]|nr:12061_t:CDS:2 [Funneliformis geosporum]